MMTSAHPTPPLPAATWRRWGLWFMLVLGIATLWSERGWLMAWAAAKPHGVVLLVPDDSVLEHPVTQAWLDAAREEGLPLSTMNSDRFVQAVARQEVVAGVLVPDTVHRQASDVWVRALETYVQRGGQALVSFDAGVFDVSLERFASPVSRLSRLAGFRYALYDALQQDTTALTPVLASREAEQWLDIQPGKIDFATPQAPWGELTTYGYTALRYPHFRSQGPVEGHVWLRSPDGDPVLSTHALGRGSVLFANMPLGYLKTRTDGYWLHRLLGHFASRHLQQPVLSAAPDGVGGLVLNLHVDSNAAEKPMLELEREGWFRQGPFSIHITAGPDAYRMGDRLGLDMAHNPRMQALLQRLQAMGHEIGNHGGWIHNVYGEQAAADNAARFEPWLSLNQKTLSTIVGQRLQSYSAPMGNQPDWATDWLRRQHFTAYYTTGNSGQGPTRSYLAGQPPPAGTPWSFPISNFLRIATLDELQRNGLEESQMLAFIQALQDYTQAHSVVRLFYFHPASAPDFARSLTQLQAQAQKLQAQGRWRWYAMGEVADFLQRREAVQWTIDTSDQRALARLHARSTQSLQGMSWLFPAGAARSLHLSDGSAEIIQESDGRWRVVAGDVRELTLHWQRSTL